MSTWHPIPLSSATYSCCHVARKDGGRRREGRHAFVLSSPLMKSWIHHCYFRSTLSYEFHMCFYVSAIKIQSTDHVSILDQCHISRPVSSFLTCDFLSFLLAYRISICFTRTKFQKTKTSISFIVRVSYRTCIMRKLCQFICGETCLERPS